MDLLKNVIEKLLVFSCPEMKNRRAYCKVFENIARQADYLENSFEKPKMPNRKLLLKSATPTSLGRDEDQHQTFIANLKDTGESFTDDEFKPGP